MEENQIVVVDVDLAHLSESMSLQLNKRAGKPKEKERDNFTIFPVPSEFRQSNKNLFGPHGVSIGPLHHGKESFKAMQDEKWRCLRDFLCRGDHITLDLCLSEIKKLEEKSRRCYSENVPLDSNNFVEMMLLDGCLALDHFLFLYESKIDFIDYSRFLYLDLLLLENQIPFFIVEKLFEIGLKEDARRDFRNYLVNVFARVGPAVLDDSIIPNPPDEIHHFVHLCYHCSIPNEPAAFNRKPFRPSILTIIKYWLLEFYLWVLTRIFPESNSLSFIFSLYYTGKRFMVIPCATELQNAGIKLRPKSKPYCMLDISFDHRVLKIPTLTITLASKTVLANLIAFEQYKLEENQEMRANLSSYALFLDSLVNTPEDVKILQKCGIVNNGLDSEEELIDFFNQICEGMHAKEDHFFRELFEEVNKYCESNWGKRRARWNRHKTQFIDTYFSSPWTTISLVAAVVIVLFTCVQTFYAVYTYYVPRR